MELSVDKEGTTQKYASHPRFKEVVLEFGALLRDHFISSAKKDEEELKTTDK